MGVYYSALNWICVQAGNFRAALTFFKDALCITLFSNSAILQYNSPSTCWVDDLPLQPFSFCVIIALPLKCSPSKKNKTKKQPSALFYFYSFQPPKKSWKKKHRKELLFFDRSITGFTA